MYRNSLIYNSLKNSLEGINNLKFTYIDDHNTVSQLDILILKVQNILKVRLDESSTNCFKKCKF